MGVNVTPSLDVRNRQRLSIGILIGDGFEGEFDLTVKELQFTGTASKIPFTFDSQSALRMTQVLQRAIQRGVPIYNAGNPSECAAIYQTALEDLLLLSGDSLPIELQRSIQQTLETASTLKIVSVHGRIAEIWVLYWFPYNRCPLHLQHCFVRDSPSELWCGGSSRQDVILQFSHHPLKWDWSFVLRRTLMSFDFPHTTCCIKSSMSLRVWVGFRIIPRRMGWGSLAKQALKSPWADSRSRLQVEQNRLLMGEIKPTRTVICRCVIIGRSCTLIIFCVMG